MSNQVAVFGGGCFWCTEAVFDELRGVQSVVSGYAGGKNKNPTYEQVCMGNTGHAEVIKIEFDPAQVSFRDLMTVFFATHDPTTLNRQGNDVGTQYRSAIFYADEKQKEEAAAFIKELDEAKTFKNSIVTTLGAAHRVLSRRRLSPEILRQQSLAALLPVHDPAETDQAAQAVQRAAQIARQVELNRARSTKAFPALHRKLLVRLPGGQRSFVRTQARTARQQGLRSSPM